MGGALGPSSAGRARLMPLSPAGLLPDLRHDSSTANNGPDSVSQACRRSCFMERRPVFANAHCFSAGDVLLSL
jgi:hypothetical protein